LEGIINIAIGNKEQGLKILEAFNNQKKEHTLDYYRDPSENMRRTKARINGLEIFKEVNNNKDNFFENHTVKTEHKNKISHINVTANGRYMTTACIEEVIIWQMEPEIEMVMKIDITKDVQPEYDDEAEGGSSMELNSDAAPKPAIACLDNDCVQLFVYTG
jgi:hypothetical protein